MPIGLHRIAVAHRGQILSQYNNYLVSWMGESVANGRQFTIFMGAFPRKRDCIQHSYMDILNSWGRAEGG